MNNPAASGGVSFSVLGRHSVLDTESSSISWIPAFAGMTDSRQAAGNVPGLIQMTEVRIQNAKKFWTFYIFKLGFVSDFDIRILDLMIS